MSASPSGSKTGLSEKLSKLYKTIKFKLFERETEEAPESNAEIYEKVAKVVNGLQFGDIAVLFLESFKPISGFLGQMTYMTTFPIREVLAFAWPEFHTIGHMMIEDPNVHIDGIVNQIKKDLRLSR